MTRAERVVEVVRGILADQPVLVHCTVGKDRTGVTVALDARGGGCRRGGGRRRLRAHARGCCPSGATPAIVAMLRSMHPEAVHLEDLATRSPAPVMRELLGGLTARYGSPADYLRAHGLGDDETRRAAPRARGADVASRAMTHGETKVRQPFIRGIVEGS